MNDEELKQWVREQVADIIRPSQHDTFPESPEGLADQILAIQKPDGTPAIGVISDNQKLADGFIPTYDSADSDNDREMGYTSGQQDMLNAGFVRLVGGKK